MQHGHTGRLAATRASRNGKDANIGTHVSKGGSMKTGGFFTRRRGVTSAASAQRQFTANATS